MIYGSVCSGIECATVAWHPLGWTPAWFSEIEPFPCRLLAHYYPTVPNLGDMLKLYEKETFNKSNIDLLVGGTPCQSFSTAGLRAGLDSPNGNLALQFCRILATKRPRWFVWENVPGVFSSKKGEDFRSILRGFSECGYSFAWRVLDAQFFGVPQRRRRVFVVGYLGEDWRPPAAVLFEPEGMRGHSKKGRKEGQEVTRPVISSPYGDNGANDNFITATIDSSYGRLGGCSNQDIGHNCSTLVLPINTQVAMRGEKMGEATGFGLGDNGDPSFTLQKAHHHAIFQYKQSSQGSMNPSELCPTLHKGKNPAVFMQSVRRFTPLECERLQGFPDGYTDIPGAKDSPRYAAIGNSMAVPVMAWIGRRIEAVDKIQWK